MHVNFTSLITIGNLTLDFFNELETRSSWKEMTDTATISIPKNITIKGADLCIKPIKDVVQTGQRVVIKYGYNGNLSTWFVGYVSRAPMPSAPLQIMCEDDMWLLKRMQVTQKVFANNKLSDLVEYICPGVDYDVLDTQLGANYSCLDDGVGTAASALKKIETVFGLKSFFRLVPDATATNGVRSVLVIGRPYSSTDLQGVKPVEYKLRANTKDDSLQYRFATDNPIQIKGIMKVAKGKDITYLYPSHLVDVSVQTRNYHEMPVDTFKKFIEADFLAANTDRYEGDITGFAVPFVRHGMVASIVDDYYEQRPAVQYFIDAVTTKVTLSGGVEVASTIGYVVNDTTQKTFK